MDTVKGRREEQRQVMIETKSDSVCVLGGANTRAGVEQS